MISKFFFYQTLIFHHFKMMHHVIILFSLQTKLKTHFTNPLLFLTVIYKNQTGIIHDESLMKNAG